MSINPEFPARTLPRRVRVRSVTVGQCFGTVGQIVDQETGAVLRESRTYAFGADDAAEAAIRATVTDMDRLVWDIPEPAPQPETSSRAAARLMRESLQR